LSARRHRVGLAFGLAAGIAVAAAGPWTAPAETQARGGAASAAEWHAAREIGAPVGALARVLAQGAVTINDGSFEPRQIEVPVGTTVTWTNRGRAPHTVTSRGAWDSGRLNPGADWSMRFDTPGTFDYLCAIHPATMQGRVVVQAPAEPTATATPPAAAPESAPAATPGPVLAPGGPPPAAVPMPPITPEPLPPTGTAESPAAGAANPELVPESPAPRQSTDYTRGTGPGFAGVGAVNPGFAGVGATAGVAAATARLAPQAGSSVTGEARLLQAGPTTTLTISLEGLAPNGAHAGHVHAGGCSGPVLHLLTAITADEAGRGQATATVEAPLDPDTWWIQYHAGESPPGPGIVCGPVEVGG
jgi:plastocyanin